MSRVLYKNLLALPAPSVRMQHAAYEFGAATRDFDLLALLAGVPGLDPGLDDKLGAMPAAKVLAVWVTRPGRDQSSLLDRVRREDRVSVQSAFAGLRGLPDALYAEMAKILTRPAALLALAENPDVPMEVRADAATKLGPSAHRFRARDAQRLTAVAEAYSEMHDALAASSTSATLLMLVAGSPEITDASHRRMARYIRETFTRSFALHGSNPRGWREAGTLTSLLRLVNAITTSPTVPADVLGELAVTVESARAQAAAGGGHTGQYDQALTALQAAANSPASQVSIAQARASDDPEEIEAAVQWALANRSRLMAGALCQNPHTDAAQFSRMLPLIGYQNIKLLVAQNVGNVEKLVTALVHQPSYINDRLLRKTVDPAETLAALVAAFVASGRRIPDAVATSAYMTVDMARQCPPTFFTAEGAPAAMTAKLATILDDEVGDNELAWKMVESLWDRFTGSLDDLLAIVRGTHPVDD